MQAPSPKRTARDGEGGEGTDLGARLLVHGEGVGDEADGDVAEVAHGRDGDLEVRDPPAARQGVVGADGSPVLRVVPLAPVPHAQLVPVTLDTTRQGRIR